MSRTIFSQWACWEKGKTNLSKKDTRGIESFIESHKKNHVQKGLVIAPIETPFSLSERVVAIPWDSV